MTASEVDGSAWFTKISADSGALAAVRVHAVALEVQDRSDQIYCLATSLVDRLTPKFDEDAADHVAVGLAKILEQLIDTAAKRSADLVRLTELPDESPAT